MFKLIVWTFVGVLTIPALLAWLMGKLGQVANPQQRSSAQPAVARPEPVVRLSSEAERTAALAALAPEDTRVLSTTPPPAPPRPQWEIASERQIAYELTLVEGASRMATQGLDRLWALTVTTLKLDELDVEWALLATGERATVTA